ncbi:hypothetical protein CANARDRAFT_199102 [[Candida] arabinofermentans NRRL YB-2248]|uniref:ferroxidase n=1 Tax=[Candida] arabinofermentans NRRL YB-2248 TaxID=983967 RepID=A0A1E4T056_9ASCO|nr:hypothetical protein CANARDRAFT_199102 [[Candida] arabinofermentans NRRL YB-2248]
MAPAAICSTRSYFTSTTRNSLTRYHGFGTPITNINESHSNSIVQGQPRRWNSISASTDGSHVPESIRNLDLEAYHNAADDTLELIYCDLDTFFDSNNISTADVEESSGILTINTTEGSYVINKQPPNKQIWFSSPLSGPKRFDLLDGEWVSLRDNIKLYDILKEEMNQIYDDLEFSFSDSF